MEEKICTSGFTDWMPAQLSDLTGKRYFITGANSGIGYEAARMLAMKGAHIVMVCRSLDKGEAAQRQLQSVAAGSIDLIQMDLSDLASVRRAAAEVRERYDRIDGLINNAGIMMTPQEKTVDGFDLQMGANHLGHFLWTGLLLDLVEASEGRVVVVSSLVHKMAPLNLEDFMSDESYSPMGAYTQSKLSNLMFAFELDRRLEAAGRKAICIACHPGYSETNLQSTGPTGMMRFLLRFLNRFMAQPPAQGAVPTVLAAAGDEALRGAYYGPQKNNEYRGPVSDAKVAVHALDRDKQTALWSRSEELVGYEWDLVPINEA